MYDLWLNNGLAIAFFLLPIILLFIYALYELNKKYKILSVLFKILAIAWDVCNIIMIPVWTVMQIFK